MPSRSVALMPQQIAANIEMVGREVGLYISQEASKDVCEWRL
jgi:hypothetical protein